MKKQATIVLLWFMVIMISSGLISRSVSDVGVALVTTTQTTTQAIPTKYANCIPIEALYQDGQANYVFVLATRSGFMGEELIARKVQVGVLAIEEGYAALDDGAISSQQEVIVKMIKSVQDGDRVRVADD